MTKKADVKKLPKVALVCRFTRHRWAFKGFRHEGASSALATFRCDQCDTVRVDCYSAKGELEWRSYDYPEGYLGHGRTGTSDCRREMIRRVGFK
jgi:hypothetical protein